jgi:ABC-type lipoprotein export system ATPase subunit
LFRDTRSAVSVFPPSPQIESQRRGYAENGAKHSSLFDEPTGNLDSRTSVEVMEIFQRLNRERGITLVLVTHEPDIAQYAQRVVVFKDGKISRDYKIENQRDAGEELRNLPAVIEDEDDG